MGAPDCRFEIIHAAMEEPNNRLSVSEMCALAGVSRSGYYNWLSSAGTRLKREIKDQEDFALILAAYEFRGYAKGVRGINMRLLHMLDKPNFQFIQHDIVEPIELDVDQIYKGADYPNF